MSKSKHAKQIGNSCWESNVAKDAVSYGRFSLKCATSFALLAPDLDNEEVEFHSAASSADEQPPSAESEKDETCSTGVVFGVLRDRFASGAVQCHFPVTKAN
eukprot:2531009-Amphidinium_carterae.1